ncbi:zinc finger, CCHC-type containing protein [Tanacetum coccineum]
MVSSKPYVDLKYKTASGELNSYIVERRDGEWLMIELCRFRSDNQIIDFKVQLESFCGHPCGSGPIFVDGIEFRPIDNVEHEKSVDRSINADSSINWDQQSSSDFQEIVKRSQYDVLTITKQELYKLLSTEVLIDNGEKLFSLSKMNCKKCHMLPAKAVINKSLNAEYSKCQPSATSRFEEVIELQRHRAFSINCNIETQMLSPDTAYACYLVFQLPENSEGLKCPVKTRDLLNKNNKETTIIYLKAPCPIDLYRDKRAPENREDGWMEVRIWEFIYNNEIKDNYIPMELKLTSLGGTMIVLSIEDKLNYLEQPLPPAPIAPKGQQVAPEITAAHTAWIKGSKEIAGLMLMTMEPEIQRNMETLHAYEMLQELKTLFAQQAEQELLQTVRDFHSCKQEEWQPVSSYVLKMKGYIDNLERLGHPVTLGLAVSLILIGLRKEFDGFVQNYNMHSLGKTVNELHAMLKLHEQTLNLPKNNAPALHAIRAGKVQKGNKHKKQQPQKAARGQNQGNGENKHAYAPKPKIPPPPKREDPAKDSICHECGETGHWKRNCPQYLAELLKKKKNAASGAGGGSGIFVIELNTFLNRSWIYDTGCGTHICNTTQGLKASRKLKPRALSLYVGNGQREAVEVIGDFHLSLPSGLVIVLNNCHYDPTITRGVISVSHLYEDGFINRFVDNSIQVSRNNMVYFSAIPRDGIFEIDLSNSYTNVNSIYAVSKKRAKLDFDSALLWHCRLGHISNKRIKKLQHDGLLNSTCHTPRRGLDGICVRRRDFIEHLKYKA